jgi:hypothetical protein
MVQMGLVRIARFVTCHKCNTDEHKDRQTKCSLIYKDVVHLMLQLNSLACNFISKQNALYDYCLIIVDGYSNFCIGQAYKQIVHANIYRQMSKLLSQLPLRDY